MDTKSLDGFRFLLALWVCLGHFYIIIGGYKFINIPFLSNILINPIHAVDGFMIITGFLMTYHYFLRESKEPFNRPATIYKFILRRLFRLYPVYIIAIVAAFFLVTDMYEIRKEVLTYFTGSSLTVWNTESKMEIPTIIGFLTHVFFIHGLVPGQDSSILSVAWSLSLEMQFYVLFPLLFILLFNSKSPRRLFSTTLMAVIASILATKGYRLFFDMPSVLILKFPLFLLGMLMAAVGLGKIKWNHFLVASLIIVPFESRLTIFVAFILFTFLFLDNIKPFVNKRVFSFLLLFRNLLSSRLSKFGADISYPLYLLHMITLPFILKFFMDLNLNKYETAMYSLITFILLNFTLSYVLHLVIEKPFIQIGKSIVNKIGFNQSKNRKIDTSDKVS